jgi:hypothetical protein
MTDKTTVISLHLMPGEIEDFENILINLEKSSVYLNNPQKITLQATLNLSYKLVDWNTSKLNSQYFKDKLEELKKYTTWCPNVLFEGIDNDNILGSAAQKRNLVNTTDFDQYIFLDCDIIFSPMLLSIMLQAGEVIDGDYIIVPQTVKLWDSTWDVICHKDFLDKEYGYEKIHEPQITQNQVIEDINLSPSPIFKLATGWFTLFSKGVMNKIGIASFVKHYGPEDTFIMFAAEGLNKYKRTNFTQYNLEGIYISENYISRSQKYKDQLSLINLKDKFRNEAELVFNEELIKFIQNYQ